MSFRNLLAIAGAAAIGFAAGYYLASPKEVSQRYVNWDIQQDVVITNHADKTSVFAGNFGGKCTLLSSESLFDGSREKASELIQKAWETGKD